MELGHGRLAAGLAQKCVELRRQGVDRLVGGAHELERLAMVAGLHRGPHLRVDTHEVGKRRLDPGERCAPLRIGRVAIRLGQHVAERADVGQEVLAGGRTDEHVLGLRVVEVAGRRAHPLGDDQLVRHDGVDVVGRAGDVRGAAERRGGDPDEQHQDGPETGVELGADGQAVEHMLEWQTHKPP